MKRKIVYIALLTIAAILFAYYAGSPEGVFVQAFGYQAETSHNIILAVLCGLSAAILCFTLFFSVIKRLFGRIFYWLGFGEESAEENFNHAMIHASVGKAESAKICLKKSRRHYKDDPRYQVLQVLLADRSEEPIVIRKKLSKPLSAVLAYAEARESLERGDKANFLRKAEESGVAKENFDFLLENVEVCLQEGNLEKAGDFVAAYLKTPQKNRLEAMLFCVRAAERLKNKDPQKALDYAVAAENADSSLPLVDEMTVNAYRALLRENKASRYLHAAFETKPTYSLIKLFLEASPFETVEARAKRIAALPAAQADHEAFVALQAYHFAVARDEVMLKKCLERFSSAHLLHNLIHLAIYTAAEKDERGHESACELLKTAIIRLSDEEKKQSLQDKIGALFVRSRMIVIDSDSLLTEFQEKAAIIERSIARKAVYLTPAGSPLQSSAAREFALNPVDRISAIYDGEQPDD